MEKLIENHMRKIQTYAAKIATRSLCHSSVPGWRGRAWNSMHYLCKHLDELSEIRLTMCILMCEKYLISYNNSTGGYYERWLNMQAEFEEQLEMLLEVDEVKPSVINSTPTKENSMDNRIKTEYIIMLSDLGRMEFHHIEEAEAFLHIVDRVKRFYAIHARDIEVEKNSPDDYLKLKVKYGNDSTDYVTVTNCCFSKLETQVAQRYMKELLEAVPMVSDLPTFEKYSITFECHCPSER